MKITLILMIFHTVARDYFRGHVTDTGPSGRDTHNLFHHGGKELRTTVSKSKLTPYLRAFQLRRELYRKPGDEALKQAIDTVL